MTSELRGRGVAAPRAPAIAATAVALAVALTYGLFAWLQWTALRAPSWDLGIFSQLAKAYAAGGAPIVPIKGVGFTLLGDHFHPLLVVLGPVWALWPSPLALLLLQAALFAVAAWPLTRLAVERLGTPLGTVVGLAFGVSWGLQSAVDSQFHEIALAVPLLAFSLVAHLRGRQRAAALWAAPLVFVKEDLGLTVAVLGLVLAWRGARRLGAALAGWGVAWTILAVGVILPALNPEEDYAYTERLIGILALFTPAEKWWTVLMLVATAGVVGLRSPLVLLMLPTLAWRFAGDVPHYWGWQWHYSAVLMPVAFAALLDGAPAARGWRRAAVGCAVAVTLVLGSQLPLAALLRPESYDRTWRWEPAMEVIAAIPEGATVETDVTLMAYLVPTTTVLWIGNDNPVPDYVVLDEFSGVWGAAGPPDDVAAWASERHGTAFELVLDTGGFSVARRVTGGASTVEE